jgi:hypothetical protein
VLQSSDNFTQAGNTHKDQRSPGHKNKLWVSQERAASFILAMGSDFSLIINLKREKNKRYFEIRRDGNIVLLGRLKKRTKHHFQIMQSTHTTQ